MIKGFKTYNKEELFQMIDTIEIIKVADQVVTKYMGRVINTTTVTNRYEIFDIRSFLKAKISHISSNFNISFYRFVMKRGTQQLTLLSEPVIINDAEYYKSFFILNSTDKSRKLNMNLGLYRGDNNIYFVYSGINNMSVCKKHLKGITQVAEEASESIDGETFDEQINSIKSLVGERVMLSKVREILVDKDQQVNHRKFDAFKNQLLYAKLGLTREQDTLLRTKSESMSISNTNDFSIDAYVVFNLYMGLFRNLDSYLVRKETERITKITQCFVRNEKLDLLLDLI